MKKMLVALLTGLLMISAQADAVATNGTDSVRITDQACPAEILANVPAELHSRLHLAQAQFQGKLYKGCWAESNGYVFVLYEDGDQGMIPRTEFKPAREA